MARYEFDEQRPIAPILKWAGGKRHLVAYLKELWEPHARRRLVEPFCGGLAVSLGLRPQKALLNDACAPLIHFYKWVRKHGVVRGRYANTEASYRRRRQEFNDLLSAGSLTWRTAELFYFLNQSCFNGLCRFNSTGQFNVPFGHRKTVSLKRDLAVHREVMRDWEFESRDFGALKLRQSDFVYLDPPYDGGFVAYTQNSFRWEDQVRLVEWIAKHKGPVVASNAGTSRIISLYRDAGFLIRRVLMPRQIAANGSRGSVDEMVAVRNL